MEVDNDLTVSGGELNLASPSNDVIIKGDWFIDQANGGSFNSASADVTFSGAKQNLTNGTFYNLIINGTDTTFLNSNIAVEHVLTLNSGSVLDGKDYNIYIHGNWTNNGTFLKGVQTVVFDGTSVQTFNIGPNGNSGFHNLTINNSAGVTANHSMRILNTLNLTITA